MNKTKNIKWITRTAILLAIALVFQLGGLPQPVTGPVINAVLYLAALLVGISSGIIIGIFTPIIAFMTGILPAPLSPMIPFIAAGNGLLVLVFGLTKSAGKIPAIVVASIVKFSLLAAAVSFLIEVPEQIAQMMTFPQLLTALGGGVIALLIYKGLVVSGINVKLD